MSRFIEVSTTGNLNALTISGFPTEEQLLQAWQIIKEEYTEAIGDEQQQLSTNLYKQIVKLQTSIDLVEGLVRTLKEVYCGPFVSMLNEVLGSTYIFDVNKPEEYDRNLQRCLTKSKGFKLTLDLKMEQYKAMQQKGEGSGQQMTREAFIGVLITLSDHAKYPIQDSITVFEYCERVRRLNEYMKKMEAVK